MLRLIISAGLYAGAGGALYLSGATFWWAFAAFTLATVGGKVEKGWRS